MTNQDTPKEPSAAASKQPDPAKGGPKKQLELAQPAQGSEPVQEPGTAAEAGAAKPAPASSAKTEEATAASGASKSKRSSKPVGSAAAAKRAAPPPAPVGQVKAASQAKAKAPAPPVPQASAQPPQARPEAAAPGGEGEVVEGPTLQVESVSGGTGGGLRNLGLLLSLAGAGLAAATFASGEVAGLVQKVGVYPGSLVAAGLALFGIGAVQRALGASRVNTEQRLDSLASGNQRLRRDFHELREVAASLGQNVDVLQEKTESLVQLTSGHGFQSSIFSLAASLDHLGITIKERCDTLDQSVADEATKAREAQDKLAEGLEACAARIDGIETKLAAGHGEVEAALELARETNEKSLTVIAQRLDEAEGSNGERFEALESRLVEQVAGVSEELARRVESQSERFEEARAEAARAATTELAQQRDALSELAAEIERSGRSTEQVIGERLAELRSVLEQGLGTNDEHLLRGLERQEGALSAGLAGITDDLAGRALELATAISAVRGAVEEALDRQELALAELSGEFGRSTSGVREAVAAEVSTVAEELRASAQAGGERHVETLGRLDALVGEGEARQGRLEAVVGERTAEFAARVEGRVGEVVQRVDEVVGQRCGAVGERVASELAGLEERVFDGLDRRHGDLVGLGHELRDVVHERTGGLEELGQRVERTLHERFDAVVHGQGELTQRNAEAREAVCRRVGELEGFIDSRQDGMRGALEGALAGVVGAELARTAQASGKLGERIERELRGIEQRLGEDLERRQAMLSGELAGLSLEVQQAAREATTQLEQLFGSEGEGEHGLAQQVTRVVARLGELEQQLGRIDERSGNGLEALQAFREELVAREASGAGSEAIEPVLDQLADRIERAIDRRADGLAQGISAELMTMAEISEERTLSLMGLLSGRPEEPAPEAVVSDVAENTEPTAGDAASEEYVESAGPIGFAHGVETGSQAEVPPALPGNSGPEAEWSKEPSEGERWDSNGSGW